MNNTAQELIDGIEDQLTAAIQGLEALRELAHPDNVPAPPQPNPPPVEESPALRSMFLSDYDPKIDKETWTCMGVMSYERDDSYRLSILSRLKENGANCCPMHVANENDYRHIGVRVRYNPNKDSEKHHWRHWFIHFSNEGVPFVPFMMADDGFSWWNLRDNNQIITYWEPLIRDVLEPLQDKIPMIVLGLEALEYWSEDQCRYLGKWLKHRMPWCKLGFHTMPGKEDLLGEDWVDVICWQEGFWGTPSILGNRIHYLREKYKKPVIAAEYSLEGDTAESRALGNAALAAGAIGAWNGFGSGGKPSPTGGMRPSNVISNKHAWQPATFTNKSNWKIDRIVNAAHDPRAWPQTITLDRVSFANGKVTLDYSKPTPWVQVPLFDGSGPSIGNAWLLQRIGSEVVATPWEYFKPGQRDKSYPDSIRGEGHIVSPITWKPGETYGMMFTTLARRAQTTTNERSNVIEFVMP